MAKAKIDANAVSLTKDGIAAIETLGTYLANEGKGLVKALRPAIAAFTTKEEALVLYTKATEIAARKRGSKVPAPVTPQRVSATAGILKGKAWACWPTFLDNLEAIEPAWDTMVNVCNWFRSKELGIDKVTGVAPSIDEINAHLSIKKARRVAAKPLTGLDAVKADPMAAVNRVAETLTFLATVEGAGIGRGFLDASKKSLMAYVVHATNRKADEEAVIAKALAEYRAAQK